MRIQAFGSIGRRAVAAGALGFVFLLSVSPAAALTITVYNADGAGEGFNDNTPVAAVGGNPKTKRGEQRLYVMNYAAQVWSARLEGDVPLLLTAKFEPLEGDSERATLGFAAPVNLYRDFLHAPVPLTWYPAALTYQYYGTDINDLFPSDCPQNAKPLVENKCPDMLAQFSSTVDGPVVLGATKFYYGIDGKSGNDIDFLSVVLHEMGHGLGLLDLIDPATGRITPFEKPEDDNCLNCSDAYSNRLEDKTFTPKNVGQMGNNQRLQAIVDVGKLFFNGPAVREATAVLTVGKRGTDGAALVFAPRTYIRGSSVSHLSTAVSPNELMEPGAFNPPQRNLGVTVAMLNDIGWDTNHIANCGDANDDLKISTSDALLILDAAVGGGECDNVVCNVNYAGGVTTADALLVLKRAVGTAVTLSCPMF